MAPQTPDDAHVFSANVVYADFSHTHNIAINEDTGFAYAVGTNTCGGGLHIVDINTPINPMFAGCYDLAYTHDSQCVVYQGPDVDHSKREICVNFNGDAVVNQNYVEIVDVTDKSAPVQVSSTAYPEPGYSHQGWLTEDHRFLLLGDESDETNYNVPTRTHIFDLSDLDAPLYSFAYEATTAAIDHNLYVLGNRVFEANYTSGLRVLEFGDLVNSEFDEIAFFDTVPNDDRAIFQGHGAYTPICHPGR